ncbi:MAG: hypothetical protein LBL23_00700 [Coriobacteriales bacterium]|jgi:hypothetical protein|nr:hypothetical protein [Coriobacteriales bacterium]
MSASFIEQYALFVILGHYGSGKTNLALNMAWILHKLGRAPVLVDLDVVNPYFRTTDFMELAQDAGIRVLGPVFGGSNLDAPSLAPGIETAVAHASLEKPVILDVGGDPDGARALARFAPTIGQVENRLVVAVINTRRPETQTLDDNLAMLQELSDTASLDIDALIGNTHLAEFTTPVIIRDSLPLLRRLSAQSGVPLLAVTVPQGLPLSLQDAEDEKDERERGDEGKLASEGKAEDAGLFLSVERLVKTSWQ